MPVPQEVPAGSFAGEFRRESRFHAIPGKKSHANRNFLLQSLRPVRYTNIKRFWLP
jgi:hypothetical protein